MDAVVRKKARAAALLLAVTAASIAAAADLASAGTASNRRAARSAAVSMLRTLRLPRGAVPTGRDPARSDLLAAPPSRPNTPALVDLHAFWRLLGDPQAALRWIKRHPPTGLRSNLGGGSATTRGIITSWEGFGFRSVPGVFSSAELIVAVAHAKGGGTALRADAQAVWVLARPPSERVPSGITRITMMVRRPGRPPSAPRTLTKPVKVRRVVALVNALELTQPGVVACPADVGPLVELDFRLVRGGAPVARAIADGSGCGLVTFTLRDRREPNLAGGSGLIRGLTALLGGKLG